MGLQPIKNHQLAFGRKAEHSAKTQQTRGMIQEDLKPESLGVTNVNQCKILEQRCKAKAKNEIHQIVLNGFNLI